MTSVRRAEVCVIGCGPAGAIVASELARAGRSVVVLEQGPHYSKQDQERVSRASDEGASINDGVDARLLVNPTSPPGPDGQPSYDYGRAVGVGGASLHWAGHAPRPIADDLAVRRRFGYSRDWPMAWADLEPWLLAAEGELGVAGADDDPYATPRSGPFPMPAHAPSFFDRAIFAPACARIGLRVHTRPVAIASLPTPERPACRACGVCKSCPSGARYSADLIHVPRMLATGRVELMSGHHVRRLESRGDRVEVAHAVRLADGEALIVQASTFVCALGGVETPRLLLLSGLGNEGGQVGRGFSDHRVIPFTMLLGRPTGARLGFATMACDHHRVHVDRREHGTFGLWLWPCWPDVEVLVARAVASDMADVGGLRANLRASAGGFATLELDGIGRLELDARKTDAFGDAVARVDLPATARDQETVARCRGALHAIGGALDARDVSGDWPLWWGSHPSGACAMAETPDGASAIGPCGSSARTISTSSVAPSSLIRARRIPRSRSRRSRCGSRRTSLRMRSRGDACSRAPRAA